MYPLNPFSNDNLESRDLFYFLLQRNPPLCLALSIVHIVGKITFPPKVNL